MEIRSRQNMPDWAQSFLSTFYSTQKVEHEAAINVKTLPKVVWNDNTFFVALDAEEGSADILNEYGNVVTALKDVTSINDVEQQLNRHVVANNNSDTKLKKDTSQFDNELAKFADSINLDFSMEKKADNTSIEADTFTTSTNDMASNTGVSTAPTTPDYSANQTSNMQTSDPSINQAVNTAINTPTDNSANTTSQQMENATQASSLKKLKVQLASTNKLLKQNQLQTQKLQKEFSNYKQKTAKTITKLAGLVNSLQDQLHAYINPGNIYDLNSGEQEYKHYMQTAKESEKAINVEHTVDLTTPKGRVSLKDRILQDIGEIQMPDEILVAPVESTFIEEQVVNDDNNEKEELLVEEPIMEMPAKKSPIKEITSKEVPDEEPPDKEVTIIDDSKNDDGKDLRNVKFLNKKESSIFKTQVCPICKSKSLALHVKTASVQDVVCHSCKAKFGVNLNNERIFKYNK